MRLKHHTLSADAVARPEVWANKFTAVGNLVTVIPTTTFWTFSTETDTELNLVRGLPQSAPRSQDGVEGLRIAIMGRYEVGGRTWYPHREEWR